MTTILILPCFKHIKTFINIHIYLPTYLRAEESVANIEKSMSSEERRNSIIGNLLQTFGLVFAAEIGDRSFFSTIALSAAMNPLAVATGAIAAHATATGVAVAGGVLLSKYLSEKVIGIIGGSLFIVFAITTALGIF